MARAARAGRYFVKSIERTLSVILAFNEDCSNASLSEVARRTGLTRASARRILLSLADLGYVNQDESSFSLRPKVLDLGRAFLSSQGFASQAQPFLEKLSAEFQDPCSLAVLDGSDLVYIARASGVSRLITISIEVGSRLPAYATAMGRVLLAALPDEVQLRTIDQSNLRKYTEKTNSDPAELIKILKQVRSRQFSYVQEELEVGLSAIAVPVHGPAGNVVAAIGISAFSGRTSRQKMIGDMLPRLQAVTRELEGVLSNREMQKAPPARKRTGRKKRV